jgi:hypothetical protein
MHTVGARSLTASTVRDQVFCDQLDQIHHRKCPPGWDTSVVQRRLFQLLQFLQVWLLRQHQISPSGVPMILTVQSQKGCPPRRQQTRAQ